MQKNDQKVDKKPARRREQVGLVLTAETKERLDKICEITGMNRCAVISMCINTYAFEKLNIKNNLNL